MKDDVYHLDLCVLAYQLHAQTLIWPLDPYYEQMRTMGTKKKVQGKSIDRSEVKVSRKVFREAVRGHLWSASTYPDRDKLRGPGFIVDNAANSWAENEKLDPILQVYERANPAKIGYSRQTPDTKKTNDGIIFYNVSSAITGRIGTTCVSRYIDNHGPHGPNPAIHIQQLLPAPPAATPAGSPDRLYCFEGATGGDTREFGSWSLMGFILESDLGPGQGYEIRIVFRGSRSGTLRFVDSYKAKGNPDWVTDMGWGHDGVGIGKASYTLDPLLSPAPMHRGFARSLRTMMPTIFKALDDIQTRRNAAPTSIMLLGHSLGGGLATAFLSAINLGAHKPGAVNSKMPQSVANWPWPTMKLVIFGAPGAGGQKFNNALGALACDAKNIFVDSDPIPKSKGTLFGVQVVLESDRTLSPTSHAPDDIREKLIDLLESANLPVSNKNDLPWVTSRTKRAYAEFQQVVAQAVFPMAEELLLYLRLLREMRSSSKMSGVISSADFTAMFSAITDIETVLNTPWSPNDEAALIAVYDTHLKTLGFASRSHRVMFRYWLAMILFERLHANPVPQGLHNRLSTWIDSE